MHREHANIAPFSRHLQRRARSGLVWGLLLFVLGQLAFVVAINRWRHELRDPEYGTKLALLRQRIREDPERPLLLVLGSSRTGVGFSPQALTQYGLPETAGLVPFNFGLTGAGPILELLCLRRLLAEGIRPTYVAVEILPPLLHQEGGWTEEGWLNFDRLGWQDLPHLARYVADRRGLYRRWAEAALTPWTSHRFCIMSRFAPAWLAWASRQDVWRDLDGWGWLPYPRPTVARDERLRALDVARRTYQESLAHFRLTPNPDRALRELLQLCADRNIKVLLFTMPEGSEFRRWYPPDSRAEIAAYLNQVAQDFGSAVWLARDDMTDDHFVDSHHLLPDSAAQFTRNFAREVLPQLVRGREGQATQPIAPPIASVSR